MPKQRCGDSICSKHGHGSGGWVIATMDVEIYLHWINILYIHAPVRMCHITFHHIKWIFIVNVNFSIWTRNRLPFTISKNCVLELLWNDLWGEFQFFVSESIAVQVHYAHKLWQTHTKRNPHRNLVQLIVHENISLNRPVPPSLKKPLFHI